MQIARTINPDEQEALLDYIEAKRHADQAISRLETAEAKLMGVMAHHQRKTLNLESEGRKFSATYTQRTTTQINEQGLRRALTAKVFDRFTVKKLDRKALEKAMSDGVVDPRVVAKFVDQVPGKTYLTYREKDNEDEPAGV